MITDISMITDVHINSHIVIYIYDTPYYVTYPTNGTYNILSLI